MSCHSQLWTHAEALAPVRESLATGTPIRWNRVHDLPDFVYFDHSIHVQRGVACETCHGPVNDMARVYQAEPLQMGWCLDCHRHPWEHLRPKEHVFDFRWRPPADQGEIGRRLVAEQGIEPRLDPCSERLPVGQLLEAAPAPLLGRTAGSHLVSSCVFQAPLHHR